MYNKLMIVISGFTIIIMIVAMALHETDLMIAMGVMTVICRIEVNNKK